jgi:hypothetical protein
MGSNRKRQEMCASVDQDLKRSKNGLKARAVRVCHPPICFKDERNSARAQDLLARGGALHQGRDTD